MIRDNTGDSEIDQHSVSIRTDDHILRFDIAMDNGRRKTVKNLQLITQLYACPDHVFFAELCMFCEFFQSFTFHILPKNTPHVLIPVFCHKPGKW